MPAELVRRAIEQSRSRDPVVLTTALLYGSRVLAAWDKKAAHQAFGESVFLAEGLSLDPFDHVHFFEQVIKTGAEVDPLKAMALLQRGLPSKIPLPHHRSRNVTRRIAISTAAMLAQGLVQHGEFETALDLLRNPDCDSINPSLTADPAMQRRILLAALDGWRARHQQPEPARAPFEHFYHRYAQFWQVLQPKEAEESLEEILRVIQSEPDHPTNTGFGERVQFRSSHVAAQLFAVFNVVRALKPPEDVTALLKAHPELERAAQVYPLGMESLWAESRPSRTGPGFVMSGGGSARNSAVLQTLVGAFPGDPAAVESLFRNAHDQFLEDADPNNPNVAPRVFWPSAQAYKQAMYHAGKQYGWDAEARLDAIPDRDIQILASIEFARALTGLNYQGGLTISRRASQLP